MDNIFKCIYIFSFICFVFMQYMQVFEACISWKQFNVYIVSLSDRFANIVNQHRPLVALPWNPGTNG